jgi:hypothetical protein
MDYLDVRKSVHGNILRGGSVVSPAEVASIRTVHTDMHRLSGRKPKDIARSDFIRMMFGTIRDYGKKCGRVIPPLFFAC